MTKKKVTAPLTYNPGKGRPKEYLAYLNYQEMQALKRLNGNNQERGPKGLPSFPPANAMSGSSAKSPASTSTARAAGSAPRTTTTRSSGPSSSLNSPVRTQPSSNVNRPSSSGGGGARDSGQAANRSPSSSVSRISGGTVGSNAANFANTTNSRGGSASVSRISGGVVGGNARDAQVRSAAASSDANRALQTPALRQDALRPVRAPAATTPMSTQGPSFGSPLDARIANRFAINDSKLLSGALGPEGVPSVSQIASENARRLNAARMAQQYGQYRSPPRGYAEAPQGVFGPRAGAGTGYLRTVETPGMITTGMPSALSGMPGPRGNAEATLRAYEEAKRISNAKQITDRIPASKLYSGDRVPAEPRLSAGRSAVVPSYPVGPSTRPFVVTDPRVSLSPGTYAGAPMDKPRLTVGRSAVVPTYPTTAPRPDPSLLRAYQGGFGPELMGAAGSEIERNLLARDPSRLAAYKGGFGPELMGAAGSELERDLLTEYERNLQKAGVPSLGKTRGLGTSEKILEVEDYFTVPPRDPADVSEEMVPGFGIDVNNIPRVQVTFDPTTSRPMPSSVYSGYGTFNVPDIVSPVIEGAPTGGKIFRDRVPGYDVSGEPSGLNTRYSVGGGQGIVALSPQTPQDTYRAGIVSRISDLTTPERNAIYGSPAPLVPKPTPRPVREVDSGADLKDTATGVLGDETPSTDYTDEGPAPVEESELATPDKPGEELTQEQEQKLKETLKRGGLGIRIGAGVVGAAGVPLAGLAGGYLSRQYQKSKIEQIKQYAAMTDAQKLAAEKRNPELVGWAHRLGIDSVNDYDFYQSWADRAGLRAPPTREGGPSAAASSGIGSLGGGEGGGQTTPPGTPPSTPTTPSTPSGRRPDIYYMWDLGVNIPSPGDPNYTLYQKYLVETLAAQQAAGYV